MTHNQNQNSYDPRTDLVEEINPHEIANYSILGIDVSEQGNNQYARWSGNSWRNYWLQDISTALDGALNPQITDFIAAYNAADPNEIPRKTLTGWEFYNPVIEAGGIGRGDLSAVAPLSYDSLTGAFSLDDSGFAPINHTHTTDQITGLDAYLQGRIDSSIQELDLGTAAQADIIQFATAAQGLKADTALQPDSSLDASKITGILPEGSIPGSIARDAEVNASLSGKQNQSIILDNLISAYGSGADNQVPRKTSTGWEFYTPSSGGGGIGLADLSATSPIQYNSATGNFSFNSSSFVQTSDIGSTVQAFDADLSGLAGLSTTGAIERTGAGTFSTFTITTAGKALIDDVDAATQRTTLGLGTAATANTIDLLNRTNHAGTQGINTITGLQDALDAKQPSDLDLTTIAALTPTDGHFLKRVSGGWNSSSLVAADIPNLPASIITSGTLSDSVIPASIARDTEVTSAISALSTVYQPLDSDLSAIAALTTTSYGRGFLDLADAAAGRTKLALGSIVTQDSSNVSITGGSVVGVSSSPLSLSLPTSALESNGQIRRNTNAVEYRDSTNATRILLNNLDNLSNLANIATARSNLKAIGSDNTGITGATTLSNAVVISQSAYDALATKDPNTVYYIPS